MRFLFLKIPESRDAGPLQFWCPWLLLYFDDRHSHSWNSVIWYDKEKNLLLVGAIYLSNCLKFILQNVNVPVATMVILTFFVANHDYFIFFSMIWLWRMCLKSILQNVNVPAATMGILTFFVANHDYFIFQELNFSQHNSWISAEEIPDMATLNFQKNSETCQNNAFFKWKCFCSITPP